MRTLKCAILLLSLFASSNNFARSPHESESLINNENMAGKIIAAETNYLTGEVDRLTRKLESTLGSLPMDISHTEGKIIAVIANQVERDLEEVKRDIDALTYKRSSDMIYTKLEQIEKDIEMI
ncbi:putative secreted protein [Halobacteriovorax marinus SJ]|uniref:Secreted protein n=1 Tax=Halobacteriovorax marinus (strain ATCC BAA-682 / DSM 15412 / SJ) TaxID=862908 RepID=E1X1N5_HALMS|nr:hypothetical protein [Halobacteriovorax marinus]CBW24954.1 putative secreted protein [Halobacteriovorax marinus SJ]